MVLWTNGLGGLVVSLVCCVKPEWIMVVIPMGSHPSQLYKFYQGIVWVTAHQRIMQWSGTAII